MNGKNYEIRYRSIKMKQLDKLLTFPMLYNE